MTKVVRKKKKDTSIIQKHGGAKPVICHGISFISFELEALYELMNSYNDQELYEYALPHIEMYKHKEMDALYPKVVSGSGKLTKKERKELEGFIILTNTELGLFDVE